MMLVSDSWKQVKISIQHLASSIIRHYLKFLIVSGGCNIKVFDTVQ